MAKANLTEEEKLDGAQKIVKDIVKKQMKEKRVLIRRDRFAHFFFYINSSH